MFGRTFRIALLLITTQLSAGCFCCCERPLFWRKYQGGGGCCEPCTTCCGAPPVTYAGAVPHGVPVYPGGPVALPAAPVTPLGNPQLDRMAPISSTALNGSR